MEKLLNDIVVQLSEMRATMNEKLEVIESRLARLEKVDSIEHRVTVNQIDLTDIKELLQKQEENQTDKFSEVVEELYNRFEKIFQGEIQKLNRRLDSQLLKIAKAEEDILMLKEQEE